MAVGCWLLNLDPRHQMLYQMVENMYFLSNLCQMLNWIRSIWSEYEMSFIFKIKFIDNEFDSSNVQNTCVQNTVRAFVIENEFLGNMSNIIHGPPRMQKHNTLQYVYTNNISIGIFFHFSFWFWLLNNAINYPFHLIPNCFSSLLLRHLFIRFDKFHCSVQQLQLQYTQLFIRWM